MLTASMLHPRTPMPSQVPPERALPDPPLLRLEAEASQAYLSVLLHVQAAASEAVKAACSLEARLTQLCLRNLERFEQQELEATDSGDEDGEDRHGGCQSVAMALLPVPAISVPRKRTCIER